MKVKNKYYQVADLVENERILIMIIQLHQITSGVSPHASPGYEDRRQTQKKGSQTFEIVKPTSPQAHKTNAGRLAGKEDFQKKKMI